MSGKERRDPAFPASSARLALVYRGPASTPGCPEAAAALLQQADPTLEVRYVGPKETLDLRPRTLAQACVYVQPGGGTLKKAYKRLREHHEAITGYVAGGGRYLGICLGAYLAGRTPGFSLLPGDTDRYIDTAGAQVRDADDTVVDVTWGGVQRPIYFQDGPVFVLDRRHGADVVARYSNGEPAAVVSRYGKGTVGVVGPHPEAGPDWFLDADVPLPPRLAFDLGVDLIRRVMSR